MKYLVISEHKCVEFEYYPDAVKHVELLKLKGMFAKVFEAKEVLNTYEIIDRQQKAD